MTDACGPLISDSHEIGFCEESLTITDAFNHPYGALWKDGILTRTAPDAGGGPLGGIGGEHTAPFVFSLLSAGGSDADVFNSELVRFKGFTNSRTDKTGVHVPVPGSFVSCSALRRERHAVVVVHDRAALGCSEGR